MEALFHRLAERSEYGSAFVTSHMPFSSGKRFFDLMKAASAIDRLVYHCAILEFNVPSCRLEAAQLRQRSPNAVSL